MSTLPTGGCIPQYPPNSGVQDSPSSVRGGRKGGTNTAIPHMVAQEYRNTASKFQPNTETAVTNRKKLTLSILQILLSNRNDTFMSVFPS